MKLLAILGISAVMAGCSTVATSSWPKHCYRGASSNSAAPIQDRSNTGAVVGAVAGGLLGSTIGHGTGRVAGAAVGAATGTIIGDRMQNQDGCVERPGPAPIRPAGSR